MYWIKTIRGNLAIVFKKNETVFSEKRTIIVSPKKKELYCLYKLNSDFKKTNKLTKTTTTNKQKHQHNKKRIAVR